MRTLLAMLRGILLGTAPRYSAWAPSLEARIRFGFIRTVICTTLLTGVFFVAYFYVQRHPQFAPFVMPRTALDVLIPFQPTAMVAYVSLWVYVGIGPGTQRTLAEFAIYYIWLSALCLSGVAIFYLWPTQAPVPVVVGTHFPGFSMLHRVDETSNACPSMHVAVAIFTAIRIAQVLRLIRAPFGVQAINLLWFVLIAYSTLAIKQHVVLDVIGGAVFGVVFAAMSLRWRPSDVSQPVVAALSLATLPK